MLMSAGIVGLLLAAVPKLARPAEAQPKADPKGTVTVRTEYAPDVFSDLLPRIGIRVLMLGDWGEWGSSSPRIPEDMRFRPVDARQLVEASAATVGLKVVWAEGDHYAIFQRGAKNEEVAKFKAGLGIDDVNTAHLLSDTRVIPPVVAMASGTKDLKVELAAVEELSVLNWAAVLIIAPEAWTLAEREYQRKVGIGYRRHIATALGDVNDDRSLALLEKAAADKEDTVVEAAVKSLGRLGKEKAYAQRCLDILTKVQTGPYNRRFLDGALARALGRIGGEGGELSDKVLPLLEKLLAGVDKRNEADVIISLGYLRTDKSFALLEKLAKEKDAKVRNDAAYALCLDRSERALALVAQLAEDPDPKARRGAVHAVRTVGGEKALELVAKHVADPSPMVRSSAVSALAVLGAEKPLADRCLAHLETLVGDGDAGVRQSVASSLGSIRQEKALTLLGKCAADVDKEVRNRASRALGDFGGEKARDLLLARLSVEDDKSVLKTVTDELRAHYPKDPLVLDALKKVAPAPPKRSPQPNPSRGEAF